MAERMRLDGRTAVITGSAGGLGGCCWLNFTHCGFRFVADFAPRGFAAEAVVTAAFAL